MKPIKLCIVTDIHHGAPVLTKRSDKALELLEKFARFVEVTQPDAVLELGDRISDAERATDLRLEQEVADAFQPIGVPVYHINGNHDRDYLSVADNEDIFNQPMGNETHDLGDWRLVLWRADAKIQRANDNAQRQFELPEADLIWLARVVQHAERPLLIVSHVPVHEPSQIGNYYFQSAPWMACYPQSPRVRAVLDQARVPVVWLAGHVHWNSVATINGVHYLTQQSLTESYTTGGEAAAAMGVLELDHTVRWRVEGRDPFACTLTPTPMRWPPPLG